MNATKMGTVMQALSGLAEGVVTEASAQESPPGSGIWKITVIGTATASGLASFATQQTVTATVVEAVLT